MIKWKTNSYDKRIEPVEVTKETACFVWTLAKPSNWDRVPKPRKESKDGIFDTWEEAHDHISAKVARNVEAARDRLDFQLKEQAEIAAMTKPEGVE